MVAAVVSLLAFVLALVVAAFAWRVRVERMRTEAAGHRLHALRVEQDERRAAQDLRPHGHVLPFPSQQPNGKR